MCGDRLGNGFLQRGHCLRADIQRPHQKRATQAFPWHVLGGGGVTWKVFNGHTGEIVGLCRKTKSEAKKTGPSVTLHSFDENWTGGQMVVASPPTRRDRASRAGATLVVRTGVGVSSGISSGAHHSPWLLWDLQKWTTSLILSFFISTMEVEITWQSNQED